MRFDVMKAILIKYRLARKVDIRLDKAQIG
jgi:hypothetical protein